MRKVKLFICALLLGVCTVSAQNITLSPEAGISVVRKTPSGEDWRPAAKVGISADFNLTKLSADFNLTKHFSIESGLFYTFRHYQIDDGGIYSNDDATWIETVSRTRHFLQLPILAKFHWQLNKDTKLFFGVGPYVGLCLKTKLDGNQRLLKGSFPGVTGQYYDGFVYGEDQAGNSNLFLYDKDRKFDWGVSARSISQRRHRNPELVHETAIRPFARKGKQRGRNRHQLPYADALCRV